MIGETVTRQRADPTTTDRYGNTVRDWTDPSTITIAGCALSPIQSTEDHDQGRQGVIVGWTLYAPPGADIAPHDRIVARGTTYEVDGEAGDWTDPFTVRPVGVEVALRVVTG